MRSEIRELVETWGGEAVLEEVLHELRRADPGAARVVTLGGRVLVELGTLSEQGKARLLDEFGGMY